MQLWEKWQEIRKKYPREEKYKLIDQLDRCIEGIASTIVEGSSKRSFREFARYIDISKGSLMESRNHFTFSYKKGYISQPEKNELDALIEKLYFKEIGFQKWLDTRDMKK